MNHHLPENPTCWKCKASGYDNFKMDVKISFTLPLENYKSLPDTIQIKPGDWASWEGVAITCRNCKAPNNYLEREK